MNRILKICICSLLFATTTSASAFANDVVILQCGQTFGTIDQSDPFQMPGVDPGINIIEFSSSLANPPQNLQKRKPCAVVIADLLNSRFKMITGTSSSTVSYTFIK
jgi:hypothetical protein